MSIPVIIAMNIGAATILSATLAAVMLVPARLRHPLADRHSTRQVAALRTRKPAPATQRGRRHIRREPIWRPVEDL